MPTYLMIYQVSGRPLCTHGTRRCARGGPPTSRDKGEKVKYRYRPHYFAEGWRPGEPSLVIPLACKGNHSDPATSAEQLASASAHAEAVRIGAWIETPGLLFSTQLPTDGGTMTVHAL